MTYSFEAGLQTGTWGAMERVWRRTVQSASNITNFTAAARRSNWPAGIKRASLIPGYQGSGWTEKSVMGISRPAPLFHNGQKLSEPPVKITAFTTLFHYIQFRLPIFPLPHLDRAIRLDGFWAANSNASSKLVIIWIWNYLQYHDHFCISWCLSNLIAKWYSVKNKRTRRRSTRWRELGA